MDNNEICPPHTLRQHHYEMCKGETENRECVNDN